MKTQMNLKTIRLRGEKARQRRTYSVIPLIEYSTEWELISRDRKPTSGLPEAMLVDERSEGCVESQASHFATTLEKYLQAS